MCCTCKCGGEEGDNCECCGGNLVAQSKTPFGRKKVALYCLNVDLLVISCLGLLTSLSGLATLNTTGDAGALGFARWAPLSLCIVGIVFGSITCRLPIIVRHFTSKVAYVIVVGLVFATLLSSGIIILLYEKYLGEAAYQDSRYINNGMGFHLKIVANDRAMAIWNICCVTLLGASNQLVQSCSDLDACENQTDLCACYQDETIYRSMYPAVLECAALQELRVPTPYNGTFILAPLVGAAPGSCGGGDPKLFQQNTVTPAQDAVRPLGISYVVYSSIMLFWAVCSLDLLCFRNDLKYRDERKEMESEDKPYENPSMPPPATGPKGVVKENPSHTYSFPEDSREAGITAEDHPNQFKNEDSNMMKA